MHCCLHIKQGAAMRMFPSQHLIKKLRFSQVSRFLTLLCVWVHVPKTCAEWRDELQTNKHIKQLSIVSCFFLEEGKQGGTVSQTQTTRAHREHQPHTSDHTNKTTEQASRLDSPSSLHSSGGFAFLASRGSSQDVVLVLWLGGRDDESIQTVRERPTTREREEQRGITDDLYVGAWDKQRDLKMNLLIRPQSLICTGERRRLLFNVVVLFNYLTQKPMLEKFTHQAIHAPSRCTLWSRCNNTEPEIRCWWLIMIVVVATGCGCLIP